MGKKPWFLASHRHPQDYRWSPWSHCRLPLIGVGVLAVALFSVLENLLSVAGSGNFTMLNLLTGLLLPMLYQLGALQNKSRLNQA